jgi:hypothetical protein
MGPVNEAIPGIEKFKQHMQKTKYYTYIKTNIKSRTMKKLILNLGVMLFFAGMASGVMAQATDDASATATIVTPIAITKTVDMNFGNAAVQAAGTVVLTPASTRTKTGGVTLPAATGTVSAAAFDVTGEGNYTFAITLPASCTITHTNLINTMSVDTFTDDGVAHVGTLVAGSLTIHVGATLNVGLNQLAGVYTSGTNFDVTVNYN